MSAVFYNFFRHKLMQENIFLIKKREFILFFIFQTEYIILNDMRTIPEQVGFQTSILNLYKFCEMVFMSTLSVYIYLHITYCD